jgi:hypothetical protein
MEGFTEDPITVRTSLSRACFNIETEREREVMAQWFPPSALHTSPLTTKRIKNINDAVVFLRMLWADAYKRRYGTAPDPDDFGEDMPAKLRTILYRDTAVNSINGLMLQVSMSRVMDHETREYECRVEGNYAEWMPRQLGMSPLKPSPLSSVISEFESWYSSTQCLMHKVLNIGIQKTEEMGSKPRLEIHLLDPCGRSCVGIPPVGTDTDGRVTFRLLITDATLLWGVEIGVRFYIRVAGSTEKFLFNAGREDSKDTDTAEVEGVGGSLVCRQRDDAKGRYSEILLSPACSECGPVLR